AAMERSRVAWQGLVDAHPSDHTYARSLAETYDMIAQVLIQTGKIPEGMAARRKAQPLWLAAAADPSDVEGQAALALSYGNVGAAYWKVSLLAEALESLEAALAIYDRLLSANPSVTRFQEQSSFFRSYAGTLLLQMGRLDEARATLEQSRDAHSRLVKA